MAVVDWAKHAARAEVLAGRYESSAEVLRFYASLAHFLAGKPNWNSLIAWGSSSTKPEIAASARDAAREDLDNLFARAFQWATVEPGPPRSTEPLPAFCPCCGGKPLMAVLRPEAEGSRRSLVCSLCTYEWPFERIRCPNCDERRFDELPVYISKELPHVRVECCATCHHYLLASDLVQDPEAIPLVEDIAAIPLHLWAGDRGYTKIESNVFGF